MITFIDLFAGIGGFHLALSNLGAECVYASEIDVYARKTYLANFNLNPSLFNDDIRKVTYESIPESDILCAGFPCQPFSQAGNKKGFYDVEKSERGNLFFCIADIIAHKRPKSFILENVRHLLKHDNGKTLKIILKCLEELNYKVSYKVLKASDFNVPQHRPRIFIVGFDREQINTNVDFQFPEPITLTKTMSDIFLEQCNKKVGYTLRVGGRGSKIDDRRNWEFYRVDGEIRRIGIVEAKRMMAFPENFKFNVSDTQAMKQLGNSVCVDVVQYVADKVINYINNNSNLENNIGVSVNKKQNKGEISEFYAFLKIIHDKYGSSLNEGITILKLYHENKQFFIDKKSIIQLIDPKTNKTLLTKNIEDFVTQDELYSIRDEITHTQATFSLDILEQKKELLNIESFKGKSFLKQT